MEGAKNTLKISHNATVLIENNYFKELLKFFKKINLKIFDIYNKGQNFIIEKKSKNERILIYLVPSYSLYKLKFNNFRIKY